MRALILGITGQDGSYLAEHLLEAGYEVHGLYRRTSTGNLRRIAHIQDRITLHRGDLCDTQSVVNAVLKAMPAEIYNLADQDDVGWSYDVPGYNYDVTGAAVGRLLEALRQQMPHTGEIKFFQAISATVFGTARGPQNELTPLNPLSPYACAKAFALHLCRFYRIVHGMHVSTAILYNHDSPRREDGYLLQKICRGLIAINEGRTDTLHLSGNLDMPVDIGFAGDYMRAVHKLMQLDEPTDLIIGSGRAWPIRYYAELACDYLNLPASVIVNDPAPYDRPGPTTENLRGDISKARRMLHFEGGLVPRDLVALILKGLECE